MALIDIPQYRSELAEIRKSLLAAGDALHIDHIREQLDELTEEMNQPEFWNDPDHSAKVNQKVSNLKGKLEHYEKLLSSADDIEVMLEMAEEEKDEDTVTEAVNELATLKEHTDALELETLMRGDYDDNDAVLSLHAGAGGTEAQDWTSMLYRMYTRYCEKMGFTVKVLDLLDGDEAGIKSVTFEVSGDHTYSHQKGWGMSLERYIEDVDFANDLLHTELFRPPYARITPAQARALGKRYKLVMWDVLSRDYNRALSPRTCLRNVTRYLEGGSIVVFHDSEKSFRNMSYALPRTLQAVRDMGLKCKAIDL